MLPLLRCFFAHLLILQYPDHHQNLISSYLYYSGPVHKISSQSVHNFLSNVVHRQTNRQTDKPTLPKNITSFAKEVIITAQWEGMGDVGLARYEPALLPPYPAIRVSSYSNYQRSIHSISKRIFRNLTQGAVQLFRLAKAWTRL